MAGKEKIRILSIFFLLCFFSIASAADFAVTINPKDFNAVPELFQDELITFSLKVVNFGKDNLTGLRIELGTEQDLAIIDNTKEVSKKNILVEQLKPGEIFAFEFLLKAKSAKSEKAIVSASYGIESYSSAVVSFLKIVPSTLQVTVKPKEESFVPTQENELQLSFLNDSEKPIKDIKAKIILPLDFETDANEFYQAELLPKQKLDHSFVFNAKELAFGKRRIALVVSFTDEKGTHSLDKATEVDVKASSLPMLLAIIAIIFLVAGSLFFGTKVNSEPVKARPEKILDRKEKKPEI